MLTTTKKSRRRPAGPGTSNTRASNTTRGTSEELVKVGAPEFRILAAGVDSLYFSARFQVSEAVARDLQRLQARAAKLAEEFRPDHAHDPIDGGVLELERFERLHPLGDVARDVDGEDVDVPVVEIAGQHMQVKHFGHDGYRWFLRSRYLDVWLNPPGKSKKPIARVRVRPEMLWKCGAQDSWAAVRELLVALAVHGMEPGALEVTVSRIDIAVDWIGGWRYREGEIGRLVTRARKRAWHMLPLRKSLKKHLGEVTEEPMQSFGWGKLETGVVIGSGALMNRIYDKTVEIGARLKGSAVPEWQRGVWSQHGPITFEQIDPKSPQDQHVMRCEFTLKADALRTFWIRLHKGEPRVRLTSPELVLRSLNDLWRYCTEGWLRLVDLTSTRKERCPTNEIWRRLSQWPRGEGEGRSGPTFDVQGGLELTRGEVGVATITQAVPQLQGLLVTISAGVGVPRGAETPEGLGNSFHEAVYAASQGIERDMKKREVGERIASFKDKAFARELDRAAVGGKWMSDKLKKRVMGLLATFTEDHLNAQWSALVADRRKKIERQRAKEFRLRFEGCDGSDPKIAVQIEAMKKRWAEEDRAKREFFEETTPEEDDELDDCDG